jgi:hypothetical protein
MVHKYTPSRTDFLPVGVEIEAYVLNDLGANLQYTHNVAEWLPPVLKVVFSCIFRDPIEFKAESFDFLLPAAECNHKVTLGGILHDAGV